MNDNTKSSTALLAVLLCRIVLLCCSEMPFTSAYVIAAVLSLAVIALFALPLWIAAPHLDNKIPLLYRLAGIYTAALLLSRLYKLLQGLQSAYPMPTLLLMLLAACFCFTLPQRTTGRVAEILVFFFAAGAIFLLGRALFTGEALLLYTPPARSITEYFFSAMHDNLPLMFLPLCLPAKGNAGTRRRRLCGCFLSLLCIPLVILAGAVQNGRLSHWEGSPFFLLVSQSQSAAAIRTDGFWGVMVIAAGIAVLVFCMQLCILPKTASKICMVDALILGSIITMASILFIIVKQQIWLNAVLIFLGVTVCPLYHILHRKKGTEHDA